MLYPKCPRCGGKAYSAEDNNIERANKVAGRLLNVAASHGHRYPVLHLARAAVLVGREGYKRIPGGGLKRCEYGHEFR
jgi:hypothetical protein